MASLPGPKPVRSAVLDHFDAASIGDDAASDALIDEPIGADAVSGALMADEAESLGAIVEFADAAVSAALGTGISSFLLQAANAAAAINVASKSDFFIMGSLVEGV